MLTSRKYPRSRSVLLSNRRNRQGVAKPCSGTNLTLRFDQVSDSEQRFQHHLGYALGSQSWWPHVGGCNMSERKAVIKNADMTQELQEDAVDVAARVAACSDSDTGQRCGGVGAHTLPPVLPGTREIHGRERHCGVHQEGIRPEV